ncbi:hypothetical protein ACS0TY_031087 [Phlomoides rotata]
MLVLFYLRLVIDRETGKPKGYGFCEYKDRETALSARHNLQGYEINGRQLRVDFAENDKNADRNREQGRGGPGIAANVDAQKQIGGPAVLGHPSLHQLIGDSVAMAAATVMGGALGSAQNATTSNEMGLQNQSLLGTDPLTHHLAKMSRSQLTDIVSELKAIATQNKEQAQQLLLAFPNFPKALFQAQIMLGWCLHKCCRCPISGKLLLNQSCPWCKMVRLFLVCPHFHKTKCKWGCCLMQKKVECLLAY